MIHGLQRVCPVLPAAAPSRQNFHLCTGSIKTAAFWQVPQLHVSAPVVSLDAPVTPAGVFLLTLPDLPVCQTLHPRLLSLQLVDTFFKNCLYMCT